MTRKSATVPPGTTPSQAVAAARGAKGFTPAPSKVKGKRSKGRRFDYDEVSGRTPGTVSRMVTRAEDLFRGDKRPDVAFDSQPVEEGERGKREAYLAAARREAERLRQQGQNVRVTTQGGIQLIGARGRIAKNLRPGYKGPGGRFTRNIERPIRDDPTKVEEAALDRIRKAAGFFGFDNTRAGFTLARENAMKLAYARDRRAKGQPYPKEWLDL